MSLFGKSRRRETELDSELAFHLQEVVDAKIAEGLSPQEARRQALLEFGGSEQVKEDCRDVHRITSLDNTLLNLKSAARFLRKSPGFSLTIILTLALGIGANSAVFSAVDAVILRALPYPRSDRLVVLHQFTAKGKSAEKNVSTQRLEDWNRLSRAFSGIAGYYTEDLSETSGTIPEKLTQAMVSRRFLHVIGVSPLLGRDFTPEEEHFGGPNAALISFNLWQRKFQADPAVIGKKLHFGSTYVYTVIGVMPPGFAFPDRTIDLWSPSPPDAPFAQDRKETWFFAFGRLKPGVTLQQGQDDLATVQAQLARQFPDSDKDISVSLESLKDSVIGKSGTSLWLLFGAVSLLLLIACSNIAALLLARTAQRAREIAIRYSLGASRASVVVQLLTESLALAVLGSMAGFFVAIAAAKIFRSLAKALPRVNEITLDWRILAYALLCAVVCTLLFGLVPALHLTRRTVAGSLAVNTRTQVAGSNPLQWTLVAVQVALAVTLLLGAALLLRSFQALGQVHPGFDPAHVLTLRLSGGWGETANMKALTQRIDNDLDAIRNVPGVVDAATSAQLPGVSSDYPSEFKLSEGHALTDKIVSDQKFVSAGYFKAMRIPLLGGTGCVAGRIWNTALVNRSFVTSFLGDQPAVGRHVEMAKESFFSGSEEIVGIAADTRENGIRNAPGPIVYTCGSATGPSPWFLIRTHGDPAAMANTLRHKLLSVDPGRSVFNIAPLQDRLFDSSSENRLRTLLLSLFAITAILLAALGLYGTLSYFVTVRRREVGLRMALGAVPAQVLRQFLKQGMRVALIGCVCGLLLAAAFSRLLSGMLYGVSRSDPASYSAVALLVLLIAAVASVLPAARAARVDPMRALHEE